MLTAFKSNNLKFCRKVYTNNISGMCNAVFQDQALGALEYSV